MLKESDYVKIVVAVPRQSAGKIRQALGKAGAGQQGKYNIAAALIKPLAVLFRKKARIRPLAKPEN